MSSRPVGLGAFANRSSLTSSYASHGAALRSSQTQTLQTQLSVFQSLLHTFALQHGEKIKKDPAFRAEFARMCAAIGVDPLAGSNLALKSRSGTGSIGSFTGSRGWLAALNLGRDVEIFYHRIAVRVIEVCRSSRETNGGLLALSECRKIIQQSNQLIGGGMEVSDADLERAVESLVPLGSGYKIVDIAGTKMIRSVPKELNTDQTVVLEALQVLGNVSVSLLIVNLGWEEIRCRTVVGDLCADSLVWVDMKSQEPEYWSPAFLAGADE